MKNLKYGRLIGIGVGAGLAVAAVYSYTTYTSNQSNSADKVPFQSLTDFETKRSSELKLPELAATKSVTNKLTAIAAPTPAQAAGSKTKKQLAAQNSSNEFEIELSDETDLVPTIESEAELAELLMIDADSVPAATNAQQTKSEKKKQTATKLATESDDQKKFDDLEALADWLPSDETVSDDWLTATTPSESTPIDAAPIRAHGLAVVKTGIANSAAAPVPLQQSSANWTRNPYIDGSQTVNHARNELVPAIEIEGIDQAAIHRMVQQQSLTIDGSETSVLDFGGSHLEAVLPQELASDQEPIAGAVLDASAPQANEFETIIRQPMQFLGSQSESSTLAGMPVETLSNNFAQTVPSAIPDLSVPQQPTDFGSVSSDPYSITPVDLGLTEAVAQCAVQHIEYGKTLARRGASQSAQQEFYAALRVIAQDNDAKTGVNEFSLSLRRGIIALKEAQDFMVKDTEAEIGLDVAVAAETHRSKVLTTEEANLLTPIQAMQRYFATAQSEIQRAVGANVVSAEALYCLGKLHSVESQSDPTASRLDIAKAMVFHRAALNSDQNNYRSANDLAVLLARSGQLNESRDLLKQSLRVNPEPSSWANLAKVHQRLNQPEMAQLAQSEFQRSINQPANLAGTIQWKPMEQFNAEAPIEFHEAVASKPVPNVDLEPTKGEKADGEEKSKSLSQKIKDLF